MRILVLDLRAPHPPYDGATVRTNAFVRALGEHHEVTLLAMHNEMSEPAAMLRGHFDGAGVRLKLASYTPPTQPVRTTRIAQLRDAFSYPPASMQRLTADYVTMARRLLKDSFDCVICNTVLTGQLLRDIPVRTRPPAILDTFDVFTQARAREARAAIGSAWGVTLLQKWMNWLTTSIYEPRVWRSFEGLIAVSEEDAKVMRRACPDTPVSVIPTGVDVPRLAEQRNTPKRFDVLIVGAWTHPPNVDALMYFDRQILPRLLHVHPNLSVAVVGKDASEQVRTLVRRHPAYSLFTNVPSMSEFYLQSRVVVIPMRTGSGIKVKLLEALAHGMPVVTTSVGAFGVPVVNGQHLILGDEPSTFAKGVLQLLTDEALAEHISCEGKNLVATDYEWKKLRNTYLEFVEQMIDVRIESATHDS